jgi:hypothetical protein
MPLSVDDFTTKKKKNYFVENRVKINKILKNYNLYIAMVLAWWVVSSFASGVSSLSEAKTELALAKQKVETRLRQHNQNDLEIINKEEKNANLLRNEIDKKSFKSDVEIFLKSSIASNAGRLELLSFQEDSSFQKENSCVNKARFTLTLKDKIGNIQELSPATSLFLKTYIYGLNEVSFAQTSPNVGVWDIEIFRKEE